MLQLVVYAAWDARLSKVDDKGYPARVSYERLAAKGVAWAIRELEPPPFPVAIEYLWRWCCDVRRGLGVGMDGLATLSWTTLDAWCRLTGHAPEPHEVDALFTLDAVIRNPDAMTKALGVAV